MWPVFETMSLIVSPRIAEDPVKTRNVVNVDR